MYAYILSKAANLSCFVSLDKTWVLIRVQAIPDPTIDQSRNPGHLTVQHKLLLTVASDYNCGSFSKTQDKSFIGTGSAFPCDKWCTCSQLLACWTSFSISIPSFFGLSESIKTNKKTPNSKRTKTNKKPPQTQTHNPKPARTPTPNKTQPTKQNSPPQNARTPQKLVKSSAV